MSKGGKPQSESQQAVRRGHFEKTMERFNLEMARKMTMSLYDFHNNYLLPEQKRINSLERMGLYRLAALAFFYWVDWRLAMGLFIMGIPGYARQTGRALMKVWVQLVILTTWEVSVEQIEGEFKIDAEGKTQMVKEGWEPKWYQGLTRRLDTDDGFIYKLKPLHFFVRWYDSFHRTRAERKRREAAELADEPTTPTLVEDGDVEG